MREKCCRSGSPCKGTHVFGDETPVITEGREIFVAASVVKSFVFVVSGNGAAEHTHAQGSSCVVVDDW